MRKITVLNHLTLDGVMQAPGRADEDTRDSFEHGGWSPPYGDEVMGARMGEGMAQGGALLLGRRTYLDFFEYWPKQTGNPFTPVLDAMQKYVVSDTLDEPLPWRNSTVVRRDALVALKESRGDDLTVMGSGVLVQSLLRQGLVDELLLPIHPLVLGSGRRLFTDVVRAELELVDATVTTTGVILATYRPSALTPTSTATSTATATATA